MNGTPAYDPLVPGSGTRLSDEALLQRLQTQFPAQVGETITTNGYLVVEVDRDALLEIAQFLHDDPALCFNYLSEVANCDNSKRRHWPHGRSEPRFESTLFLLSIPHGHRLGIKVRIPEDDPRCPSVASVWRGADWHERESYDLMGIEYTGHPDLRRILMPEDWIGHPLRKDHPLGSVKSFFYKRDDQPHAGEPKGLVPRIREQQGDI